MMMASAEIDLSLQHLKYVLIVHFIFCAFFYSSDDECLQCWFMDVVCRTVCEYGSQYSSQPLATHLFHLNSSF